MTSGQATLRWLQGEHVFWRRLADTLVLLAPGSAEPIVVLGSAGVLWELLATPMSLCEITTVLAKAYGVDAATAGVELEPILEALVAAGALLEVR